MQVAPGLHPYFKGPDPKGVADKSPRVYGDTQDAPQMTKTESGVGIGIVSIDMPQRVIWSDMPDEYHCLEPISIPEALEPGQTRTFSTELFILPQNGAN
jgi:galactose mutarotase-like enzyme